jgi:hypothetical protein
MLDLNLGVTKVSASRKARRGGASTGSLAGISETPRTVVIPSGLLGAASVVTKTGRRLVLAPRPGWKRLIF